MSTETSQGLQSMMEQAKANAKANQKTAERHLTSCSRRSQSAYRCPSPRTWVGCGRSEPETVWAGRRGPRPRRCGFPGRPGNRAVATHTHRQPTSPESQSDLNRNTNNNSGSGGHYLLLRTILHRHPVLSVGAQVHLVRADEVVLRGLFGDGALSPNGGDEPEEPQVNLQKPTTS